MAPHGEGTPINPYGGLPPYADLVFREETTRLLGPGQGGITRLGLLCHLIRLAKPTGDGAWVITCRQEDIAAETGLSPATFSTHAKLLAASGLINIAEGPRHGPNGGRGSNSYYLYPNLLTGSNLGPQTPHPGRENLTFKNSRLSSSRLTNPHLVSVSPQGRPTETSNPQGSGHVFVVEESSKEQQTAVTSKTQDLKVSPDEPCPAHVRKVLDGIGWSVTYPAGQDWGLLLMVLNHMVHDPKVNTPARLLNSTLRRPEGLLRYARSASLLALDIGGRLDGLTDAPEAPAMDLVEYGDLAEQFPEWNAAVLVEAKRRASHAGIEGPHVPMLLRRQAALTIPIPEPDTSFGT